jgi:hypothetical protein
MTNHHAKKSPLSTGVKPNEQYHQQVIFALILNRDNG